MCLGIPGRIITIDAGGRQATVEYQGALVKVNLALVDGCQPGSYVLVHAGHAISVIDTEEAEARLNLWRELTAFRGESLTAVSHHRREENEKWGFSHLFMPGGTR